MLLTAPPKAEEHPGFTDALLDILQAEQEASIRLSSKLRAIMYPAAKCLLTSPASCCLLEKPCHERMVTKRRLSTKQGYTRR
jgi:hypothetical protein